MPLYLNAAHNSTDTQCVSMYCVSLTMYFFLLATKSEGFLVYLVGVFFVVVVGFVLVFFFFSFTRVPAYLGKETYKHHINDTLHMASQPQNIQELLVVAVQGVAAFHQLA